MAEDVLYRGLIQRRLFCIYPAHGGESAGKGERFCRHLQSCSVEEFGLVYGAFLAGV